MVRLVLSTLFISSFAVAAPMNEICGANNAKNAVCYKDNPAVKSTAIARVDPDRGTQSCTGFLVGSGNYFMTNNSCIKNQQEATASRFIFNFQTNSCDSANPGNDLEQTVVYSNATLIFTNEDQDSTLLRLETPVDLYQAHGSLTLSRFNPHQGDESYVIHHPDSGPKQITWDDCKIQSISSGVGHNCYTYYGSHGAPIIKKKTGEVLAIHSGGCPYSTNKGKAAYWVAHLFGNKAGNDIYDDITRHHTIKCKGDNVKVYRVTGKTRRHYPTPEIAESWDVNYKDHVVTIDCTDIFSRLKNGPPMRLREEASITCFGIEDKVFRLEGNRRRHYPTGTIASSWDPNWQTDKFHLDCSNIPEGADMARK